MKKRHLRELLWLGPFFIILGILMVCIGFFFQDSSLIGRIAYFICSLLVMLLGLFLCVYDPYSIVTDDDKMELHNLLRPNVVIYYDQIRSIKYPVEHSIGHRKETRLVLEMYDESNIVIRDYYSDFYKLYKLIQSKNIIHL